jgi:LPS O-antigen subunit length determinant protein (WzzB/FepE family)
LNKNEIYEDEIDLRDLFKTIWDKRKFIIIFTFVITALAIVYALMKTPIYEAKTVLEIGNYKDANGNVIYIADSNTFVKKLQVLFIDIYKNEKNRDSKIESINIPKKQDKYIEITTSGLNNEVCVKEINKVLKYTTSYHEKLIDEIKKKRYLELNNIIRKIDTLKNNEVKLLDEKIALHQSILKDYRIQLETIEHNLTKIQDNNPSLAALKLMEKRDLSNFILNLNEKLMDMINKKDILLNFELQELIEQKELQETLLLPHNYKNTAIIGQIMTNDYPTKPRKKLIVTVAFVTGFILSIFLVFFMHFMSSFKNTKKENELEI